MPHFWVYLGLSRDLIRLRFDYPPRADAADAPSICQMSEHLQEGLVGTGLSEEQYTRLGQRWWLEAAERYYTLAAREFVEEVRELDGALPVEPPADSSRAVAIGFSGPLLLDVSFARSGDNMRTAAAACREAVRRWLGWKRVAMDRTARQGQRDPADTSGTVGWCRVAGARRRSRRDCAEIAP